MQIISVPYRNENNMESFEVGTGPGETSGPAHLEWVQRACMETKEAAKSVSGSGRRGGNGKFIDLTLSDSDDTDQAGCLPSLASLAAPARETIGHVDYLCPEGPLRDVPAQLRRSRSSSQGVASLPLQQYIQQKTSSLALQIHLPSHSRSPDLLPRSVGVSDQPVSVFNSVCESASRILSRHLSTKLEPHADAFWCFLSPSEIAITMESDAPSF